MFERVQVTHKPSTTIRYFQEPSYLAEFKHFEASPVTEITTPIKNQQRICVQSIYKPAARIHFGIIVIIILSK